MSKIELTATPYKKAKTSFVIKENKNFNNKDTKHPRPMFIAFDSNKACK